LIKPHELIESGWGLIYVGKKTKVILGNKANTQWGRSPFKGNERKEILLLVSALRRYQKGGK